eukprot:TRINITY_DN12976_c1_g2_i5.p1 TRINITY_DN12976_c1_g2~~TRINITY_DN12976_c1_g2_i5.p1  ORF type:complete len:432 (+),score=87.68 TRINITY_DN12976_c1_g2_i5:107-1402(+)
MIAPGNHLLRQGMAAPAFQPQQLQHQQGLTTTMGHVSHAFTQPPSGNSSTALMFMPSNTQVAPALSQPAAQYHCYQPQLQPQMMSAAVLSGGPRNTLGVPSPSISPQAPQALQLPLQMVLQQMPIQVPPAPAATTSATTQIVPQQMPVPVPPAVTTTAIQMVPRPAPVAAVTQMVPQQVPVPVAAATTATAAAATTSTTTAAVILQASEICAKQPPSARGVPAACHNTSVGGTFDSHPTTQGPYSMQLALADSVASDNLKDPDNRSKAYMSMINALDSWGFFQNLPLDAAGTLHYSAPFCHDHFETILIVPFLVQRILDQGAARQMTMAGCDQNPQEPWWTAWREWTSRHFGHRGVSLDCFVRDLERLEPPKAGARLVFMNFYRQEAEATVEECRLHGAQAEIRENPYYAGTEKYAVGTSYRYAVLVQPIL